MMLSALPALDPNFVSCHHQVCYLRKQYNNDEGLQK